jgi:predicted nucleic acid-binding protein
MQDDWKWVVTPPILSEYLGVLARPKFKLNESTLAQWRELLAHRTFDIGTPPATPDFPRDPKDAPFLAAALFASVDWLITGDFELLSAPPIPPTRIATVAQFAAEFQIK